MLGLPLAFVSPLVLIALAGLPLIWWLLRLTPPRPQAEVFPPTRILSSLIKPEETPAQSPWWLTLLRLLMAALVIFAMAGPVWNPANDRAEGEGPLLLVIDDGWASGNIWDDQIETAQGIVSEAGRQNRSLVMVFTASGKPDENALVTAEQAAELLEGAQNIPIATDHAAASERVSAIAREFSPGSAYWLSDGTATEETTPLARALANSASQSAIVIPDTETLMAMGSVANDPDRLRGRLTRLASDGGLEIDVVAHDVNGISIARNPARFEAGETETDFSIEGPVELRNQIVRLSVEQVETAGSVQLLDEGFRRRLVGLVSGETYDIAQPLLSPLYYISRALEPFSDIRRSDNANVAEAVPALINQGVSAMVLADVGLLNDDTVETLTGWLEDGGMLIRFAGPRLAAAQESVLLPVEIRPGDRNLGGALSWETPKPVAEFDAASPFFGLDPPQEVTVNRQVLALQEPGLDDKTWARLEDGTPLVTADRVGAGWIVLFHVSSETRWSNLPISGTFVEMLRRVVNQANSSGARPQSGEGLRLPPLRLLDGKGQLQAPPPNAQPLVIEQGSEPVASLENLPGQYGTEDGFEALNLFGEAPQLVPVSTATQGLPISELSYATQNETDLKPWLILAAALLLLLDCLAVLWIGGALKARPKAAAVSSWFLGVGIGMGALVVAFSGQQSAYAQSSDVPSSAITEDGFDYSATLVTRFAWVKTGIADVDQLSEDGLRGLTRFVFSRTALEPGEPVGVDIESDELSFYPLLYWPIHADAELPTPETMARIDAYMKQGGSIIFDTKDQISGPLGGTSASAEARYLQALLSNIDIPPLEPVPSDHVLTKAFYLLDQFPGRFAGGDLWVESIATVETRDDQPARAGDGVSAILITSNDFAGAWAVDEQLRPLYQTIPPDPLQREMAFRVGVNLVMYTLTGNYKADQVHIPALLERLGQ